jgi:hypothetical protein
VGSDLLYDAIHAQPLAACLARRLDPAVGRAHIMLAVRRGELVAALACAAQRRGLLVGLQALDPFEGEVRPMQEMLASSSTAFQTHLQRDCRTVHII